jgi:hypothetical protein
MPTERTVRILWAVALVGGIAVQAGLGVIDGTLAYLVTTYTLWIVCAAVYRCRCCCVKGEVLKSEHIEKGENPEGTDPVPQTYKSALLRTMKLDTTKRDASVSWSQPVVVGG